MSHQINIIKLLIIIVWFIIFFLCIASFNRHLNKQINNRIKEYHFALETENYNCVLKKEAGDE